MRILIISKWFPYPPDNGSRIRVYHLLKGLGKHHDLTLLSFGQGPVSNSRVAAIKAFCPVVHVIQKIDFIPARPKALLGFFSARPRSFVHTYSKDMQILAESIFDNNPFDAVVACEIDSAPYAMSLRQVPRVLDDVEISVIYEQYCREKRSLLRFRNWLTWMKYSRFVARLLGEFDGYTVVSGPERDLIKKIAPWADAYAVVPNGVGLEKNRAGFGEPVMDTLVYPGALTYDANFDAMLFFLRHIFPLVRGRRANVRLRITGSYEGVAIDQLPLGVGVELTGYLSSIEPVLAESWACVVPLRSGSGTRVKILEAMAMGTPVISTTKGAEGLQVTDGENILIADKPLDFAEAVVRLLGDSDMRNALSANGRRLVETQYSWEICANKLERFLCQVVEKAVSM